MVVEAVSGRDVVLGRLRAAIGESGAGIPVPRDYRREGAVDLDLLVDRLTDYRARVHRVPETTVAETIADLLPASATVVVPPGLPSAWLPATVTVLPDDGLDNARIAAADGVVTAAAVAVAETGTVVLDGSPDQGRRVLSLLPDLHICVVRAAQVVAGVPAALARLTPHRPLTWISGPSATSDIELHRVEGVHGPRTLHVILLP
ncbi:MULTISPECIES: LUD domain-containing protein [unclassified Micromonospora]|uniref:LutC/YkgG family protein n=1 Tax=unclassified Micromonospora TaxID=2617518 RepID=UPI0010344771|nr:LUD domain-containing protein [Verrucosispora sp. SN26_14.1]TBL40280.1 lactate utilization protein C [Verrucosispora sp. SN26_14.1]